MAPDDRPDIPVPVEGLKEFFSILQSHAVEPAAVHGDRMVMQTDHAVTVAGGGERIIHDRKARGAQAATGGAGDGAIE